MDDLPHISEEQLEEFDRFHLKQMSPKEESDFAKRLNSDSELKAQFDSFLLMAEAVEETSLREQLNDFHSSLENTGVRKIPSFSRRSVFAIAASLLVLISLGILLRPWEDSNTKLFNSYYSADPGLPTVMGENHNYAFYEGMVDYKQGNYELAIEKWQKLHAAKANNDTINYFLASALMANGKTQNAIPYFDNALKNKQSAFFNEASFYQGLAHLKSGNQAEAIKFLEQSNDPRSTEILEHLLK